MINSAFPGISAPLSAFDSSLSPEEHSALAWLCSIKNFNGRLGMRFVSSLDSPADIFSLSEDRLKTMLTPAALTAFLKARAEKPVENILESLFNNNASFISYYDSAYPEHLKSIPDAPLGIFVRGNLPSDAAPSVAIIGARNCSEYGMHVASELGSYLGSVGIQVISGMAYGIDGISQRAALESGGTSYGVLGSGVDVCYPPSNRSLYDTLLTSGGIISTYGMGEPAIASNFPPRNRIVSGLSDAVVVIEARQKSGTIITVDMALEQGRDVYAVPGRITDRLSDGCNGLIGQGANIYLSPEIFVSELMDNLSINKTQSECSKAPATTISYPSSPGPSPLNTSRLHRTFEGSEHIPAELNEDQALIYSILSLTPMSVESICEQVNARIAAHNSSTPYSYSQVSMLLMQLMLDNHARQVSQGQFAKVL